ncbi:Phosphotransferase enzyme family protein [Bergeyella porcorum]|uniref:Phosphotransferase enzyme family protein n=1 Tax=Bergeyella porcorum TaxID=1735111 RepID=A0AAU0F4M2_9FLAO
MEEIKDFFKQFIDNQPFELTALPQSGSSRKNYIAKTSYVTYVVTQNQNTRENQSFFYFTEVFSKLKLNTPQIFAISEDKTIYIQEFLGEKNLSQTIEEEGLSDNVKALVKETLNRLYLLQTATKNQIDYTQTFEYERYDHIPIIHDLYYFKNFMVDVLELPYHKTSLLKEFYKIAEKVETLEPKTLMIRDFQARNIMINTQNQIGFIDYQSAMEGVAMYDVVSFLFQAKANFPEAFKKEMIDHYISLYDDKSTQQKLRDSIAWIQLMRYLQVLGAYGFRGLVQKKKHFLNSIEQGIENIYHLMTHWDNAHEFPELTKVIKALKKVQPHINI